MTSVWNNSNANSAIVNTVLASPSVHNPNVYSTKEITPPHAVTWTTIEPPAGPSGEASAGSSTNFTLSKFGIIEQILLSYDKYATTATESMQLRVGDVFRCIRRIDLLSSSRVISTLSSETLIAQWSNLEFSQVSPILTAAVNGRAINTGQKETFVLPLVFPLMNEVGTQMNSTFLEPLSIQVHWNHLTGLAAGAAATGAGTTVDNIHLKVRYKNYPEESTSQILAGNFSSPELNLLSETWYNENTVVHKQAGDIGTVQTAQVDLKNTDAVTEFYVIVQRQLDIAAETTATLPSYSPIEITELTFTGSGQEIFKLSGGELHYQKLTNNGFATTSSVGSYDEQYPLQNVGEFQTGRYAFSAGTDPCMSNCMSLREVNAPRITVKFKATGAADDLYQITVVEKALAIYAISSATGRMTLALSN